MINRFARVALHIFLLTLLTARAPAAEITVSAAASLADAFRDIKYSYEAAHPGEKVWLNTGASGALLQQIRNGAPVDVFASADADTMTSAVKLQLAAPAAPKTFALNELVLITRTQSRVAPQSIRDLTHLQFQRLAIGNPLTVPAGRYARDVLKAHGLWAPLQPRLTLTESVRQALSYVARGHVEAGLVYATDARLVGSSVKIALKVPTEKPITYLIAPLKQSREPAAAAQFVDYVLSPAGQAILQKHGFLPR